MKKRTKIKRLKTIVLSPDVNDYDSGEYASEVKAKSVRAVELSFIMTFSLTTR
jgi:hypothetical protein